MGRTSALARLFFLKSSTLRDRRAGREVLDLYRTSPLPPSLRPGLRGFDGVDRVDTDTSAWTLTTIDQRLTHFRNYFLDFDVVFRFTDLPCPSSTFVPFTQVTVETLEISHVHGVTE